MPTSNQSDFDSRLDPPDDETDAQREARYEQWASIHEGELYDCIKLFNALSESYHREFGEYPDIHDLEQAEKVTHSHA